MTTQQAQDRAARLGLSTWMAQTVAAGDSSETIALKCVGFASIQVALGEAETWEDAFSHATRVIFSA
jgi:hypothetical protein